MRTLQQLLKCALQKKKDLSCPYLRENKNNVL